MNNFKLLKSSLYDINYHNIAINYDMFKNLRQEYIYLFDLNFYAPSLQNGYFGNLLGKNIWVNKDIKDNHIRVYLSIDPDTSFSSNWSIDIDLERLNKLEDFLKLTVFW